MSWNPLKIIGDTLRGPGHLSNSSNSSNDEGHHGASGTSNPSRDKEPFKSYQTALQQVESNSKHILKNSKKLSDSLSYSSRNQVKLTKDLSNSYLCQVYDQQLRSLTEDWHSFNCQLADAHTELTSNIHKTITEPVKKINKLYEEVRTHLKKRDDLQRTISKLKKEVAKLSEKEKTGNTLVNLQKTKNSLEATEQELSSLETTLIKEVPSLLDYRIQILQPSLEAFVRSELSYWGDNLSALQLFPALTRSVDNEVLQSWPYYQSRQESLINSISALSIVDGSS